MIVKKLIKIQNAKIIGDTLSVAIEKVKPIEIRVICDIMTESRRCNVTMENNKITRVVGIF